MMSSVSMVALGGAIGAVCRYLAGLGIIRLFGHHDFPVAVMTVNVIGSFLMGVFVVAAAMRGLTHLSPLVMTGLLGGFTTFSAFSLETANLIERGAFGQAALYVCLSVGLSVGGLFLGLMAARGVFA
ncbi:MULTISPECIES: fluoride efflux transporter CrcB [Leisingera]|uniref:fluoride efflux transporter CrcB n=1 Tax=Leisingera TaxID=191028 RepID=UPI000482254F|nr:MULTISPECIES: fluoride efflux transporter CrcB [Leisingera]